MFTTVRTEIYHEIVGDCVYVYTMYDGRVILGELQVDYNTGEILWVGVFEEHRRQGIATDMFEYATEQWEIPGPYHSPSRTSMGDAWRLAVGGPDLP